MPAATTDVTVENLELTPQRVTFDGVDLGGTLDNVGLEIEYMKAELFADQFGKSVEDRRINGVKITVKTKIAEVRDPDVWAKVFPHATLITNGPNKAVEFRYPIGASDLDVAAVLTLHPVVKPDGEVDQDHTFWKATPAEVSPITYGPEEQSGLEVTWNCYRETLVDGTDRIYRFGDPTLTG